MSVVDDHKRCLACSYILGGLAANRCPACGRFFDPDDPETFAATLASGRSLLAEGVVGLGLFLPAWFAGYLRDLGAPPSGPARGLAFLGGLPGGFLVLAVGAASLIGLSRGAGTVRHRGAMWVAFLLSTSTLAGCVDHVLS